MWFENIVGGSNTAALDRVIGFTEARHKVLADNIANIDTPGYKMRDLQVRQFHDDLKKAIDDRTLPQDTQIEAKTDFDQYLLFHDNNNRSIEKQMTAMTENTLLHNTAVDLLRSRYLLLEKAISLRP